MEGLLDDNIIIIFFFLNLKITNVSISRYFVAITFLVS